MTPRQYYYLDDQRRVFNDVHGVRRSADVFVNLNLRPIMAGEKENYGMKFDKWLHKKLDIIFFLFLFFFIAPIYDIYLLFKIKGNMWLIS